MNAKMASYNPENSFLSAKSAQSQIQRTKGVQDQSDILKLGEKHSQNAQRILERAQGRSRTGSIMIYALAVILIFAGLYFWWALNQSLNSGPLLGR